LDPAPVGGRVLLLFLLGLRWPPGEWRCPAGHPGRPRVV